MGHIYTGGCACGAVRYEKSGETVAELLCQCQHCRQRSGAGHSAFLVFASREGLVLHGAVKTWDVAGDSGNIKHHAFCPNCGTPLFVSFAAAPDMIALHPGSLDDPSAFAPQFVTYNARGQAWDALGAGVQKFAMMPG
ncbi:MAG: GFA family protein [Pseudomonadota bacterium]